jgi:hypothetical protein
MVVLTEILNLNIFFKPSICVSGFWFSLLSLWRENLNVKFYQRHFLFKLCEFLAALQKHVCKLSIVADIGCSSFVRVQGSKWCRSRRICVAHLLIFRHISHEEAAPRPDIA